MDPIRAISLASTIITFVEFSWTLVTGAYESYKSPTGEISETKQIGLIITDVQRASEELSDEVSGSFKQEKGLRTLALQCVEMSKDMIKLLRKLRNEDRSLWKSVRARLQSMTQSGEVKVLLARISDCRAEILSRLSLMLQDQHLAPENLMEEIKTAISNQKDSLERKLGLSRAEILERLGSLDLRGAADEAVPSPGPSSEDVPIGVIVSLVKELRESMVLLSVQQRVLKQLWFPSMYIRQESLDPATPGTFEWIFQRRATSPSGDDEEELPRRLARDGMRAWLETDANVFHVSGRAGSGKSTMTKLVFNHDVTRTELEKWASPKALIMSSFYFWKPSNLTMPLEGFYRSILFEVILQCPDLIKDVFPVQYGIFSNAQGVGKQPPDESLFRFSLIREAFQRMMSLEKPLDICFAIFIDGLDEFKGSRLEHERFAKELNTWAENPNVKLFTSARPHSEFLDTFKNPRYVRNVVIDLGELNRGDIQMFSQRALEVETASKEESTSMLERREKLAEEISMQAAGIFLWAVLAVRLLKTSKEPQDELSVQRTKLKSLPDDLNLLYNELLDTVDAVDRPRSDRLLLLVSNNPHHEPLKAIVYPWLDLLDDPDFPRKSDVMLDEPRWWERSKNDIFLENLDKTLRTQLESLTRGLLEATTSAGYFVKQYQMQFLHRTVGDFLLAPEKQQELRSTFPDFDPLGTYVRLSVAEIGFLSLTSRVNLTSARVVWFLADCIAVPTNRKREILREGFAELPVSAFNRVEDFMEILDWRGKGLLDSQWFLHFAAHHGQNKFVLDRIVQDLPLYRENKRCNLLLSALATGNVKLGASLIELGYSVHDRVRNSEHDITLAPVWMAVASRIFYLIISLRWDIVSRATMIWDTLQFLLDQGAAGDSTLKVCYHSNYEGPYFSITLSKLLQQYSAQKAAQSPVVAQPRNSFRNEEVARYISRRSATVDIKRTPGRIRGPHSQPEPSAVQEKPKPFSIELLSERETAAFELYQYEFQGTRLGLAYLPYQWYHDFYMGGSV